MTDNSNDSNPVITPGGAIPKENVHAVQPGEAVRLDESGKATIVPDNELVITPGGYRPMSQVFSIEPGQAIRVSSGRLQKLDHKGMMLKDLGPITHRQLKEPLMPGKMLLLPKKELALNQGWIADAGWTNTTGTPLSSFTATWKVPPEPANRSSQLIYLFNGIQNSDGILQPVLQWGYSPAGGGKYWSIASWFVGFNGQAIHTNLVKVNPDDVLVGVMALASQSGDSFDYTCEFKGIPETRLPLQNAKELTWCNLTLEAYMLKEATDYPNIDKTTYDGIDIKAGATNPILNWMPQDRVTDCGQHVDIVSDANPLGAVDIFYGTHNQKKCFLKRLLGIN